MSNQLSDVNKKLRLGIEAAKGGKNKEARVHLQEVLAQDPRNIPAMFWLAFVMPSPEESIRLLGRVLALDPDNERAKAGIRWAKGKLGLESARPDSVDGGQASSPPPAQPDSPASKPVEPEQPPDQPAPPEDKMHRKQFLSGDVQKKAKKGALAHRARRTIDPLITTLLIITTLLGGGAMGLGMLAFALPDTPVAWVPTFMTTTSSQPTPPAIVFKLPPAANKSPSVSPDKSFTYEADTILIKVPQPVKAEVAKLDSPIPAMESEVEVFPEAVPPILFLGPKLALIEPQTLIGPELSLAEPEVPQVVDNSLLAYQPAYPGEKWIEVNVTTQQVTAWEGDIPKFSFTVSTGLPNTPTVLGKFNIYWKLKSTLMTGSDYYLPDVPYTMYFYGGYALHGTYWHSNFGQPMSHGCVNLTIDEAKQLFEWAGPVIPPEQTQIVSTADNPGTLVVVHQ